MPRLRRSAAQGVQPCGRDVQRIGLLPHRLAGCRQGGGVGGVIVRVVRLRVGRIRVGRIRGRVGRRQRIGFVGVRIVRIRIVGVVGFRVVGVRLVGVRIVGVRFVWIERRSVIRERVVLFVSGLRPRLESTSGPVRKGST
jgi:hypothetical protein